MKTLVVALGQQFDIRDAFQEHGDVVYWDWSPHGRTFNYDIVNLVNKHKPDLVWMQIQTPNVISPNVAKIISEKCKVVNWTGDVRYPLPQWFINIGREIHLTLFTNMHDVEEIRRHGVKSEYLQIGPPNKIFTPEGEKRREAEIIFMGNNNGMFPLSHLRKQMVNTLREKYGNRFKAYGVNWQGYQSEFNQPEEAKIYRGCDIAINLSHFDYSRYSSDRLFRIMAAGAFCLSHKYKDIEMEFKIGEHLDTWESLDDLVNKIEYWLRNPAKRLNIAAAGCTHIHENHCWSNRINELMKML